MCESCIHLLDKSFDQPELSEWFDWSGLLKWSGWTFLGCSVCWLAPSSIFSHIHSHLKYYTFGSVSAGQEFSLFFVTFCHLKASVWPNLMKKSRYFNRWLFKAVWNFFKNSSDLVAGPSPNCGGASFALEACLRKSDPANQPSAPISSYSPAE